MKSLTLLMILIWSLVGFSAFEPIDPPPSLIEVGTGSSPDPDLGESGYDNSEDSQLDDDFTFNSMGPFVGTGFGHTVAPDPAFTLCDVFKDNFRPPRA